MNRKIIKSNTFNLNNDLGRKLFWSLLGFVTLAFLVYIYLIGLTVFNIVERKNAEAEIKSLSNHLSQLEFEYLDKSREINLEYAKSLGFKEPQRIGFVGRAALTKNILGANEI